MMMMRFSWVGRYERLAIAVGVKLHKKSRSMVITANCYQIRDYNQQEQSNNQNRSLIVIVDQKLI